MGLFPIQFLFESYCKHRVLMKDLGCLMIQFHLLYNVQNRTTLRQVDYIASILPFAQKSTHLDIAMVGKDYSGAGISKLGNLDHGWLESSGS